VPAAFPPPGDDVSAAEPNRSPAADAWWRSLSFPLRSSTAAERLRADYFASHASADLADRSPDDLAAAVAWYCNVTSLKVRPDRGIRWVTRPQNAMTRG
jgi:hypothetical protein